MRLRLIFFVVLFFPSVAFAYDPDFEIRGKFIVEASNAKVGSKNLEVWNIHLLRGLIDGKEAFIDFDVVRIPLRLQADGRYALGDIDTYKYDEIPPTDDVGSYSGNSFTFSLGVVSKTNIKLDFNENGSLKDLTASITNPVTPDDVTIFRLFKEQKEIVIVEPYRLLNDRYYYQPRFPKKGV